MTEGGRLDSSGSGQGQLAGSCKYLYEPLFPQNAGYITPS
jgi:hypothetical protein